MQSSDQAVRPRRAHVKEQCLTLRFARRVLAPSIALVVTLGCREPVPDPLVLNERGLVAMSRGDIAMAIQLYDTAIKLKPNFPNGFRNRGVAYATKGEYDRAIRDYDQAIKLLPDMVSAYNSRGVANQLKGNFDKAVADFDQAVKLKPSYAVAIRNRGRTQFYRGRFAEAAADLEEGLRYDSTNAYVAIWLYMARRHLGQDDGAQLAAHLARTDSAKWPAPIGQFLLGRITADRLAESAAKTSVPGQPDQRCAAAFYIGEAALWKQRTADAIAQFRETLASCPKSTTEYIGARAALERLSKTPTASSDRAAKRARVAYVFGNSRRLV